MIISGQAEFTDATIASNVRLIRSNTGDFEQDIAPAVDGSYSATVPDIGPYYVTITAPGQRAFAHGPINAI